MLKNYVVVIQAGGKGTRLKSLTKDKIPKPLLEINGKPMIEWQIENVRKYGIQEVVLIIGHLGNKIKEYFQDGARLGVHLTYIEEKEPLGSAGSLYDLKSMLCNENFIFIFGDVMFDMDLNRMVRFHEQHHALATLAVHPNTHPYDSDLVILNREGQVTGFDAKTNERMYWYRNLVNAGIYIISDRLIRDLAEPQKLDLEKDLILPAVETGEIYGYQTTEYIKDAGTPDRFHEVSTDQRNGLWEMKNLRHKQKCIFMDRDGTLNVYKGLITDVDAFELEKTAAEAVGLINKSGYLAIVATNQPVVARGMCERSDVAHIHRKMEVLFGRQGAYVDDIIFCPHHPDRGYPEENVNYKISCTCRKPNTGMILQMAEKYHIDLSKSYMIGDSTVDIQTGINAGLRTVLVKTGQAGKDGKYAVKADFEADTILEAIKLILRNEGSMQMTDYTQQIGNYLEMEKKALENMPKEDISRVMNVLETARLNRKRIFICGNGGSASTASHYECDFNKGVSYDQEIKYDFECLSDNVPMMMAIANDISYDDIFVVPLRNKLNQGDVVIGISGSGNSENVVRALAYANETDAETIAICGYSGEKIKEIAKHNIHVKIDNMQIVEDVHLMLDHLMMYILSGAQN